MICSMLKDFIAKAKKIDRMYQNTKVSFKDISRNNPKMWMMALEKLSELQAFMEANI